MQSRVDEKLIGSKQRQTLTRQSRWVLTPPEKPVEVNDISRFDVAVLTVYLIPMILIIVFSFLILSPAAPVAKFVAQLGGQR